MFKRIPTHVKEIIVLAILVIIAVWAVTWLPDAITEMPYRR